MKKILLVNLFLVLNSYNVCAATQANESYKIKSKNFIINLVHGNILDVKVDAIVNPANETLQHLGGLCGTIHNAAGSALEEECLQLPVVAKKSVRCKAGDAVITKAYNLKNCKYVIHAVGPDYNNFEQRALAPEKLKNVYKNIINLMQSNKLNKLAVPAISVGIFNYPMEQATKIAIDTIIDSITNNYKLLINQENNSIAKEISFVIFNNQKLFDIYKKLLDLKIYGKTLDPKK